MSEFGRSETGPVVTAVDAWELLDSRGDPTVRVQVETRSGSGTFTVPSGASTGAHEAHERRDNGEHWRGRGVSNAVQAVHDELAPIVEGQSVTDQGALDAAMVEADGTENLSRLGANAILGVSGALAHAASDSLDQPLSEYFGPTGTGELPMPMVNILSGGLHAEGGIEIQDVLVIPAGAPSYSDALETVWDVRQAVRDRILDAGHQPLTADEGGFAPPMDTIEDAFDLLVQSVRDAGHEPARDDVAFAVDVAATHFFEDASGTYELDSVNRTLEAEEMVELMVEWTERYPLVSIEDPLAEDDWAGWSTLTKRLGSDVQILGDDLLVTDVNRLARSVEENAANAVLVKPNQAGTISRALEVIERAQDAGFEPVVSARSGETCDHTIADLAVGLDAGQIKIGSLARSERLAKYNRLLEIERTDDPGFAGSPL